MTAGAAVLAADGYRFVVPVELKTDDFDAQGHLNNASTVRLFNDLRVVYVREVGAVWLDMLRRDRLVVAAREIHVLYESEGLPDEEFVGAKTKPAFQAGFIFQQAAALKCGLQNRHKAVLNASAGGLR